MNKQVPFFAAAVVIMALLAHKVAKADDPAFLSLATGWFDFNRQKDQGGEFRLEYKSDYKFLNF